MEKIFSYGTLQYEKVQLETFGRRLIGQKDILIGYTLGEILIKDQSVIEKSGTDIHPILKPSDSLDDEVAGMIFEVTQQELAQADAYEVEEYQRVRAEFKSGTTAWVYADRTLVEAD